MNIVKGKKIAIVACLILVGLLATTKIALSRKPVEALINISQNDFSTNNSYSSGTSSACGSYFDTYENADERADLVFVGEVIKVNNPKEILISETYYPNTGETIQDKDIYTVSELRVDKVIKGNIKTGDIVEVKQESGGFSSTQSLAENTGYFKEGERRIFLLETYEDSSRNTPASPINPHQGSMLIINGKTKITNNFQFINDNIDEDIVVDAIKEKIKNKENKK